MKKERRMRVHLIAAAILFTACAGASGQAYRWVDKDGKVQFTDAPPPPGAKDVRKSSAAVTGTSLIAFIN